MALIWLRLLGVPLSLASSEPRHAGDAVGVLLAISSAPRYIYFTNLKSVAEWECVALLPPQDPDHSIEAACPLQAEGDGLWTPSKARLL